MSIQSFRQLQVTREKLALLEGRYKEVSEENASDAHLRELSRRSLKRIINQMKEEIARFEAHAKTKSSGTV